jgi:hypothetical protein
MIHKFGHCVNYNYTCEVETAYAEVSQESARRGSALPLQPKTPENRVFTHFWVDNFDVLVDRQIGGGSVHTTHLVAYQTPNPDSVERRQTMSIERRKCRRLHIEDINIATIPIEKKKNPPSTFSVSNSNPNEVNEAVFNGWHLVWMYLRKCNSFNQRIPIFKGWKLKVRLVNSPPVVKSIETYLPPINAKVTDYQTIQRYMCHLQDLAEQANMHFVNISLDVGAAMNAYLVTWNAPERFNRVVIHLGSFHFLKENFQVIN